MIIIEGMDNSGKSTLAQYLAQEFDLPLMRSPKNRTNIIVNTLELLVLNPHAIMDRFTIISEKIYGPILRGRTAFDNGFTTWDMYFERLLKCHPMVFYCRPPATKVLDFGLRQQMTGVAEHSYELLIAYDTFMESLQYGSRLQIVKYDFTRYNANNWARFEIEKYHVGLIQ